jgi:hypothetical protein
MFRPLGIMPGATMSAAAGVSGDGRVVVGWTRAPVPATNTYAVRWDLASNMHFLVQHDGFSSGAAAASFDGSIILGNGAGGATWLWTEASGRQFLPSAHGALATVGMTLSASGDAVTGYLDMGPTMRLFRWRSGQGVEDLGTVFGQEMIAGNGISADGDVIAGTAGNTFPGLRAVRWTLATGIEVLPMLPGATGCASYQGVDLSLAVVKAYSPEVHPEFVRPFVRDLNVLLAAVIFDSRGIAPPGTDHRARSLLIRIRFRAESAMSASCWSFQRPTSLARLRPPNCFSQPKISSSSLRLR